MVFTSKSAKAKSKATVNKLFENILPGSQPLPDSQEFSATQQFHRQVSSKHLSSEEVRKLTKSERRRRNKTLNKNLEHERLFHKVVKHNIIKNHKSLMLLSPEEEKYLKKLIKKNSSAVRRTADVDNLAVKHEMDQLRAEILALENEKYDRSRDRQHKAKLQSFQKKAESGVLSVPGLTPGLAPVGYDSSDEE